jgi:hypothetical protein
MSCGLGSYEISRLSVIFGFGIATPWMDAAGVDDEQAASSAIHPGLPISVFPRMMRARFIHFRVLRVSEHRQMPVANDRAAPKARAILAPLG